MRQRVKRTQNSAEKTTRHGKHIKSETSSHRTECSPVNMSPPKQRKCGFCREPGHNVLTCCPLRQRMSTAGLSHSNKRERQGELNYHIDRGLGSWTSRDSPCVEIQHSSRTIRTSSKESSSCQDPSRRMVRRQPADTGITPT